MTRNLFSLVLVIAAAAATITHAQTVTIADQKAASSEMGVLASAKNLYASASYEAALLQLSANDSEEDVDQIDTYRALCLLALDRQSDAEQTLEGLVTRQPLYVINDSDYSPRLVSIFRSVRKRVLPNAAAQMYISAKAEYESKNYGPAVAKFKQLMSVLSDPDVTDATGRLGDIRELADGFMKLSQQKLLDMPPPPAAMPAAAALPSAPRGRSPSPIAPASSASTAPLAPPAPDTAATPAASNVAAPPIGTRAYTAVDAGVQQPVIVKQALPAWRPPQQSQLLRNRSYSGRLEVVIDERGVVEKATLVKSVWPTYDSQLLQTAKTWSYQPAQKDGKPVKFVKIIDITVNTADTRP